MVSLHRRNGREQTSKRRMFIKGLSGGDRPDRALPVDLRLRAISESIPPSYIDELWVFPPLPNRDIGCEFLVLLCYDGGEDRRRILTSHVDAQRRDPESEELEWVQRLREQGTAPQRLMAEIPDRLLQRLSDAGTPEVIEVGGLQKKWEEAVTLFAERRSGDPHNGNGGGSANGHANGARNGNGDGGKNGANNGFTLIDSRARREVTFRTVIETNLPVQGRESGIKSEADS